MPKVKDKTKIKTQRFSILMTKKMQRQMQKHPEINWSAYVRHAIELRFIELKLKSSFRKEKT